MKSDLIIYKCRRCGKLETNTECGEGQGLTHVQHAIIGIVWPKNQLPLPMVSTHACKDGGFGVTDLIGCQSNRL